MIKYGLNGHEHFRFDLMDPLQIDLYEKQK